MYIEEILQKEEEKHRLRYIGIVEDWASVVSVTRNTFVYQELSFTDAKAHLLDFFYSSILHYGAFIEKEKSINAHLKRHHFKKTELHVSAKSNYVKAKLDEELKTPPPVSFAWHFSNMIYDEIYDGFCWNLSTFGMPQETDAFFFSESQKRYPLTIEQVVSRLEANDSSFWNICAQYLQDLSRKVVNYFLQRSDSYGFSDVIKDETWTDVYGVLQKRLIEKQGKLPVFKNGSDFRNYLIQVCKFQAANLQRKYAPKGVFMEDVLQDRELNFEEEDDTGVLSFAEEEYENSSPDYDTGELDINTDNPYEVAYAVSMILLNSNHPLHPVLIDGIEDKVRILIDKAVNEMSYNDIITELYEGKNIGKEAFQSIVVKSRKDYERVRKTLCERLKNIINKKTARAVTNKPFLV